MKKSILNLGKALNKADQKQINGGASCNTYSGPGCYGIDNGFCGSCRDYHTLPAEHQPCVLVSINCFSI